MTSRPGARHAPEEASGRVGARSLGEPSSGGAPRPAHGGSDREQLVVVTFSHAVQHFYPAALAVAYPFVVTGLHVSYATLGIVLGVAGVLGGLLQAAAVLVERVSARLLLGLQNLGLAAATALGAAAPGFALFGVARVAGALASWPQHPVGSALLTRRFPHRRAYALSWHVAGGSLGTAVVPLAASGLIAGLGWQWGLGLFAIPLALGGLLVVWRLHDAPPPVSPGAGAQGAAGPEPPAASRGGEGEGLGTRPARPGGTPLGAALRRREVLAALGAGTIAAAGRGLGALTTYVPAYLRSGLHLSTIVVGALFTVVVVGSIAGPVVAGRFADRLGRRRVLVAVYLAGACAIAGFALVGRSAVLLALVGLALGAFAYAESPLLQAVFSEAASGSPERSAFGVYFAVAYGVGALWLTVVGELISHVGFRAAFLVMAASFVVAAAIVLAGGSGVRAGGASRGRRRGSPAAPPAPSGVGGAT